MYVCMIYIYIYIFVYLFCLFLFSGVCLTPANSQRRSVTQKHHHASPCKSTGGVKGPPTTKSCKRSSEYQCPLPTHQQSNEPRLNSSIRVNTEAWSLALRDPKIQQHPKTGNQITIE